MVNMANKSGVIDPENSQYLISHFFTGLEIPQPTSWPNILQEIHNNLDLNQGLGGSGKAINKIMSQVQNILCILRQYNLGNFGG